MTPESGRDFACLYRYDNRGSLTVTLLRESSSSGGEISCQYAPERPSGQAVFSKDRNGRVLFAFDGSELAPIVKAAATFSPNELNGVWKPSGGGLSELEFYRDASAGLCGTALGSGNTAEEEGSVTIVPVFGRTVDLDIEWQGTMGHASATIHKRLDGAFCLASKSGGSPWGLRYYRLDKIEVPPLPPWEQLNGKWETDRLSLVELGVSRGSIDRGSFIARAQSRCIGEITGGTPKRYSMPLNWTCPPVTGTGSIRRQRSGTWQLKLDNPSSYLPTSQARPLETQPSGNRRTPRPPKPGTLQPWRPGTSRADQREAVKKWIADGVWYALRPYQAPPSPPEPPDGPEEFVLTLRATGLPANSECEVTMRTNGQQVLEKVKPGPGFSRGFTQGTVIELEAYARMAGLDFDSWECGDMTHTDRLWRLTNDYDTPQKLDQWFRWCVTSQTDTLNKYDETTPKNAQRSFQGQGRFGSGQSHPHPERIGRAV